MNTAEGAIKEANLINPSRLQTLFFPLIYFTCLLPIHIFVHTVLKHVVNGLDTIKVCQLTARY